MALTLGGNENDFCKCGLFQLCVRGLFLRRGAEEVNKHATYRAEFGLAQLPVVRLAPPALDPVRGAGAVILAGLRLAGRLVFRFGV